MYHDVIARLEQTTDRYYDVSVALNVRELTQQAIGALFEATWRQLEDVIVIVIDTKYRPICDLTLFLFVGSNYGKSGAGFDRFKPGVWSHDHGSRTGLLVRASQIGIKSCDSCKIPMCMHDTQDTCQHSSSCTRQSTLEQDSMS